LVGVLAGLPLGILSTTLTARLLGSTGFGDYALLVYVGSLATGLSELGLTTVLQRRVALAYGRDDRAGELAAAQAALPVMGLRLLSLVVVMLFFVHDPLALALVILSAVTSTLAGPSLVFLTGTSRSAVMAQMGILCTLLAAVALVGVAAATHRADLAFGAYLLGGSLPNLVLLFRTGHPARELLRGRIPKVTKPEWRFGLMAYLHTQLSTLVFSRSELLFFPGSRSSERGSFAAASTIASRSTIAIDALFGPVPAALATAFGRGRDSYQRSLTSLFRVSAAVFALTFPAVVVVAVAAAPYLFPESFGDLTVPVVILVAVSMLQSAIQPASAAWTAEGEARPLLIAALVSVAANLILSAVLIPQFGLPGAVVSSAAAGLLYLVWATLAFRGRLLRGEYRRYVVVIAVATGAGCLLGLTASFIPGPRLLTGALLAVFAVGLGGIVVRVSRVLRPAEIELLTNPGRGERAARLMTVFGPPLRLLSGGGSASASPEP
jgi:O-antigen/teichoic acid export membrane protein